jgi:aspartyl-tRNA(Asn)/glutamyl-tRNA(Gln) amidotransferase subunit A
MLDRPLSEIADALRRRRVSAVDLTEAALTRHEARGETLRAYKAFDPELARAAARSADEMIAASDRPPPLAGLPISVKDLYGVDGFPTYAGTARQLPEAWSHDGWLVARMRAQGAVPVGKTHTVEMAYGALGNNPHWGTPRNPWDAEAHRVPGGSSAGAGVSLWEGSAVIALGSDTGGSIRIPASMTGTVGHKTTVGRWPTDGVVPLSSTLDTVGALSSTVADSVYLFGAVDPAWGDPAALLGEVEERCASGLRIALPRCAIWDDCSPGIGDVLHAALEEVTSAGVARVESEGRLLDEAFELYMTGAIGGAECRAFLERELPGWMAILHPTVGSRLGKAPSMEDPAYREACEARRRMAAAADALFGDATVLVLPTAIATPPLLDEIADLDRYVEANRAALRPTCPISMLDLCAVTIPVGLDGAGMPVGLQFVARGGEDEAALAAALEAERVLGTASERFGAPPLL